MMSLSDGWILRQTLILSDTCGAWFLNLSLFHIVMTYIDISFRGDGPATFDKALRVLLHMNLMRRCSGKASIMDVWIFLDDGPFHDWIVSRIFITRQIRGMFVTATGIRLIPMMWYRNPITYVHTLSSFQSTILLRKNGRLIHFTS